jgi:hypothetical protein
MVQDDKSIFIIFIIIIITGIIDHIQALLETIDIRLLRCRRFFTPGM